MAKFRLAANAEVDVLTQGELDHSLRGAFKEQADATEAALGQARKYGEASGAPSGGPATVGPNAGFVIPANPNSGYVWAVRSVGIVLSSGAILNLWKVSDSTNLNPSTYIKPLGRGTSNSIQAFNFSNTQGLLKEGDFLACNTQGATTLVSWWFSYQEAPEQTMWRLDI